MSTPHELPPLSHFLSELVVFWANFLLYVILVTWAAKGQLIKAWSARRAKIEEEVANGKIALQNAHRELEEARSRLSTVDSARQKLKAQILEEAELEAQHTVHDSKQRAERILHQARLSSEAERRTGERAARRELVDQALHRARQKVKSELTPEVDRAFRDAAVAAVKTARFET